MKCIIKTRNIILFSLLLSFFIIMSGCEFVEVDSIWKEREITIDGKSDDWAETLYYIEEDNISFGLMNNDDFLYICLISSEPLSRWQVMRQGFTVWFDPNGGKKKIFGIKFPLGMQRRADSRLMRGEKSDTPEMGERAHSAPDLEQMERLFERSLDRLEILSSGKEEGQIIGINEVAGFELKIDVSGGMLIYECKVPLNKAEAFPYAIGAKAGDLIGIGFETPKINRAGIRESIGGRSGIGDGMERGRSGMAGSMRGGGMGRGGMSRPKSLKLWAKVQLTSK